jgi:nucleoside-diphosphate-sugar epimerase
LRTLITGGAGFIGTHLAERLVADGADVVLLDNYRRNSLKSVPALSGNPKVTVIEGDVLDPASLDKAVSGATTVVHMAAIAGVSSYYQESLRTLQVNILGTVNVLEAALRHKVHHFIDFSTSEVFGPDALWVTEESHHGIGPVSDRRWVYATSKLASEHFTLRFGEQHGFASTCVRPFNIYGPRQTGEGAISNFCRAALSGQPLEVYGDGTPIRAWCYITDMVDAVELILKKRDAAAGETFNIGNPREIETTLGLARRVLRFVPGASLKMKEVTRGEVRARVPQIDKARRLLGYEPKVGLEEGLKQTFEWFRSAEGRKAENTGEK